MKIELTPEEFKNLTCNKPINIEKMYPETEKLTKTQIKTNCKMLNVIISEAMKVQTFSLYIDCIHIYDDKLFEILKVFPNYIVKGFFTDTKTIFLKENANDNN